MEKNIKMSQPKSKQQSRMRQTGLQPSHREFCQRLHKSRSLGVVNVVVLLSRVEARNPSPKTSHTSLVQKEGASSPGLCVVIHLET